jgi:hypothetical protein
MTTYTNRPTTTPTSQAPTSWWEHFKQTGYYFRPVAIATILCGIYLHVTRLLVGDDILLQKVMTPLVDQLLAIPMTYAGVAGILSWRQMQFRTGWHKVFLGFIVFYIAGSIPLHVATYFTQSTAYIRNFPMWFSLVLLPYYAVTITTLWRLQFNPRAK